MRRIRARAPTSRLWADAHVWTRPCGVGPAHGLCQAQSTPPPSPLRACRLRQSASAARCGMAPMPMAVTPHAIAPVRKWPGPPLYTRLLLYIGHQPRGQPRPLNIPACSICTGMLLYIGHPPRGKPRLLCIPACSIYTGMVLYAQRPPRGKPRLLYVPACSVYTGMLLYVGHPPLAVRPGLCTYQRGLHILACSYIQVINVAVGLGTNTYHRDYIYPHTPTWPHKRLPHTGRAGWRARTRM